MAGQSRDLKVRFVGDASSLDKTFKSIGTGASSVGSKLASVGKTIAKGAAIGTVALAGVGVYAVKQFEEAEQAAAQTAAVIKSTGGAANVTAKQVGDLANSIMGYSGISDEAVQSGENMLLTFKNIQNRAGQGNDIFNQATSVLADMSTAMGTDMKSGAIQLGKALNDPVKGITALTRVGVTFTDQQKKQIEAMTQAGDTAGAQSVILKELQGEFGGSAKAMGQTFAGQLNILKESLGNVLEGVGGEIVKAIQPVLPILTKLLGGLAKTLGPIISDLLVVLGKALSKILPILEPVVTMLGKVLGSVLKQLAPLIAELLPPLAKLLIALLPIAGILIKLALQIIKPLLPLIVGLADVIATVVTAISKWIRHNVKVKEVGKIVAQMVKDVAHWLGVLVAFFKRAWELIKSATGKAWDWMKSNALATFAAVKKYVIDPVIAIKNFLTSTWNTIKDKVGAVWDGLKNGAQTVWDGISGIFKTGVNTVLSSVNWLIDQLNKVQLHIHVDPPGPIPAVNFDWGGMNIPHIPLLAAGGLAKQAGWAIVGERGPEALFMQRGAVVSPLPAAGGIGGGGSLNVQLTIDRRRFGRAQELDVLTRGR